VAKITKNDMSLSLKIKSAQSGNLLSNFDFESNLPDGDLYLFEDADDWNEY
jgi:hypothetical protein